MPPRQKSWTGWSLCGVLPDSLANSFRTLCAKAAAQLLLNLGSSSCGRAEASREDRRCTSPAASAAVSNGVGVRRVVPRRAAPGRPVLAVWRAALVRSAHLAHVGLVRRNALGQHPVLALPLLAVLEMTLVLPVLRHLVLRVDGGGGDLRPPGLLLLMLLRALLVLSVRVLAVALHTLGLVRRRALVAVVVAAIPGVWVMHLLLRAAVRESPRRGLGRNVVRVVPESPRRAEPSVVPTHASRARAVGPLAVARRVLERSRRGHRRPGRGVPGLDVLDPAGLLRRAVLLVVPLVVLRRRVAGFGRWRGAGGDGGGRRGGARRRRRLRRRRGGDRARGRGGRAARRVEARGRELRRGAARRERLARAEEPRALQTRTRVRERRVLHGRLVEGAGLRDRVHRCARHNVRAAQAAARHGVADARRADALAGAELAQAEAP